MENNQKNFFTNCSTADYIRLHGFVKSMTEQTDLDPICLDTAMNILTQVRDISTATTDSIVCGQGINNSNNLTSIFNNLLDPSYVKQYIDKVAKDDSTKLPNITDYLKYLQTKNISRNTNSTNGTLHNKKNIEKAKEIVNSIKRDGCNYYFKNTHYNLEATSTRGIIEKFKNKLPLDYNLFLAKNNIQNLQDALTNAVLNKLENEIMIPELLNNLKQPLKYSKTMINPQIKNTHSNYNNERLNTEPASTNYHRSNTQGKYELPENRFHTNLNAQQEQEGTLKRLYTEQVQSSNNQYQPKDLYSNNDKKKNNTNAKPFQKSNKKGGGCCTIF